MSVQLNQFDRIRPTRRSFLLGALAGSVLAAGKPVRAANTTQLSQVRALTFDMQGTVFDFSDPLSEVAKEIGRKRGLLEDWAATLPADWSGAAHSAIVEIAAGRRPWIANTEVYREVLTSLLIQRGVAGRLTTSDQDDLLDAWGSMVAWPDAVSGITQLRQRYIVSTLTNAAMSQMIRLVKNNKLPFDEILTGELDHAFKPDPAVYKMAVAYLGFRPDQLMMVSAHKWDLQAAKRQGFLTAYVPRPLELGPGHAADRQPESFIDIMADDLVDLGRRLAG